MFLQGARRRTNREAGSTRGQKGAGDDAIIALGTGDGLTVFLSLVEENRQRDQSDSDDPENDVFCAALVFVCHSGSTPYLKTSFKSRLKYLSQCSQGFDAVCVVPTRWYPVNFTISRTWIDSTAKCSVSSTRA
jgi:hypothetical protein